MKILAFEAIVLTASIASILYGDIVLKVLGVALLLVGIGGIFSLIAIARRDWSIALTEAGIEVNTASGRCFVQWEDIEEIKVIKIHRFKMIGIRLSSYDNYLKIRDTKKVEQIQKIFALFLRMTDLLIKSKIISIISVLINPLTTFITASIATFNKTDATSIKMGIWHDTWKKTAKGERGTMEANRAAYGVDITIAGPDLDRSPEEFAQFLRTFRNTVLDS